MANRRSFSKIHPIRLYHNNTIIMLLQVTLALLLTQAPMLTFAYQSCAFRPLQLRQLASSKNRHITSLQAVAEFEELRREKEDSNSDDNSDAWIPTASGGFLPRFLRRHQPPQDEHNHDMNIPEQTIMTDVSTLADYKRVVADEAEQMVVVLFHAPWCRACKATQPLFRKLAREYTSSSNSCTQQQQLVKFVRVPLTQNNGFLHDGLGVPSLPYAHLYHPTAGLVEERKINKHKFDAFANILKEYVNGECIVDWSEGVIRNDDAGGDQSSRRGGATAEHTEWGEEPSLS
ncbi:hypothetical protein MPSEU_000362600 [Mayamaea pseudoterrestris]|nr:hypothetical protein MPSEU_000362600 [Mayamaea pseudoterrestris]